MNGTPKAHVLISMSNNTDKAPIIYIEFTNVVSKLMYINILLQRYTFQTSHTYSIATGEINF